ncbi:MAG: hypothetical protein QM780_05745 [Hyphomicrobium sp.]|uniref:hypothetical protein n=1 Tax=Hyphomicrobium sp. TaxID=82 RepID=UPI0039E36396
MIANILKVVLPAILACTFQPISAWADNCGDRVSRLEAENKDLSLKQRMHVTSSFDAFYLENRDPSAHITISCGPAVSSFDVEWSGGSLSAYSALIDQVSQSLDLSSDDFSSSLKQCWSQAAVSDDDEEGTIMISTSRAQISCIDKDGRAQISVSRPSQ